MKDEELAEEYSQKICGYVRVELAQAFLAGLKTGRLQWHKVADGDLPSDKRGHVVINQDWDKVIFKNGRFEYLDGCKSAVIAWCEPSTYKE